MSANTKATVIREDAMPVCENCGAAIYRNGLCSVCLEAHEKAEEAAQSYRLDVEAMRGLRVGRQREMEQKLARCGW
jgi:hypothetical protein